MLSNPPTANGTMKILDLNKQYRSDQIRQLLMEEGSQQPSAIKPQDRHMSKTLDISGDMGDLSRLEQLLQPTSTNNEDKEVRKGFEEELKKLQKHYEELEKMRSYLNSKIEMVEQMELENLENHLVLDHRLKHSEVHRKYILKNANAETQTDQTFLEMIQKEKKFEQ